MQLKNETAHAHTKKQCSTTTPSLPPSLSLSLSLLSVANIARTFHETSFVGKLACSKRVPASKLPLCYYLHNVIILTISRVVEDISLSVLHGLHRKKWKKETKKRGSVYAGMSYTFGT